MLARLAAHPALQRLARSVLVALGVACVAFALIRALPGDPVRFLLGDQATEANVAQYRELLGLNGSLAEQFVAYVGGLLRGDLGRSLVTRQPVSDVVARTLPVTLWLIAVALAIGIALALPLAVVTALHHRGAIGHAFRVAASISLALPVFVTGLAGIVLFSLILGMAPVAGYDTAFPANIGYLWLPALVICGVLVPILARVLQSSIVETLDQEFVETAIVRGLPQRILIWRHLLRPSLAPTIALLGYMIGQMLGAAVLVEMIFGLPGIGTALIDGVLGRDYSLVQGIIFVFGLIVVVVSFVADLLSGWLDPRTRSL